MVAGDRRSKAFTRPAVSGRTRTATGSSECFDSPRPTYWASRNLSRSHQLSHWFWNTGASEDDCAVSLPGVAVCPAHPGFSGIGGDGTGLLVHGTGVPILFPFQRTPGSS
jgi:hypothetical protein